MSEEKLWPPQNTEEIPVYHTVVKILGIIGILALGGAITLAFAGKAIPESVVALGSASIGALAGLLAPSPAK